MLNEIDLALMMKESGLSLSLAESCTGGLLAARITEVPGCSAYFSGALVAYGNDVKADLLRVPLSSLCSHGAVSGEVARAMAEGALVLFGSDLAISITGIAGPDGGSIEKPVGTVFIAFADKNGSSSEQCFFRGGREEVRGAAVEFAIKWLERYLKGRSG